MKNKIAGGVQLLGNSATDPSEGPIADDVSATAETQQPEDALPPAEELRAASPAPITHPSEGGSYIRDPKTGHLTKQEG